MSVGYLGWSPDYGSPRGMRPKREGWQLSVFVEAPVHKSAPSRTDPLTRVGMLGGKMPGLRPPARLPRLFVRK